MSDELFDAFMDFQDEESPDRTVPERAPFGYLGAKTRSLKYMMKHIPVRRIWVDHFCGSGVVTLNRPRCPSEIMNDRYGGIIAFYRCLRDPEKKQQMLHHLQLMPKSREEFIFCRKTWVTEQDDVIRAAKWYYIMQQSMLHKGHCFGRSKGSSRNPMLNSMELFEPVHHRLQNVTLENLDFEVCFKDYDRDDTVHYFDPPYIDSEVSFYDGASWNRDDVDRLLRCVANAKGFCAVSGYYDTQIDKFPHWTKHVQWDVVQKAEPNAFSEDNKKAQHAHRNPQQTKVTEHLWIKDN